MTGRLLLPTDSHERRLEINWIYFGKDMESIAIRDKGHVAKYHNIKRINIRSDKIYKIC